MKNIKDQLSWEEFKKNSSNIKKPIKTISAFNRLIGHTNNFFLIAGYGAFTKGYILIISKEFLPSFGLVENKKLTELKFLIKIVKKFIDIQYNRDSVVFEHGMCACIGGLDRAHIHIMSIPKNIKKTTIKKSINEVLQNRKAGINYVEYKNYKLENIHDINQIFESLKIRNYKKKIKDLKINGKIFSIKDIQNLPESEWPIVTRNHIMKGGHYVYFQSDKKESSFLTTQNFQTQFGREVVFNIELKSNKKFQKEVSKRK